jgi:TonB family protein
MFLERLNLRLEATLVLSLALHAVVLSIFLQHQFNAPAQRLELTEVEFQAEAPKPTEIEKLMNRLSVPPKPPAPAPAKARAAAAVAELERSSFQQVVGLRAAARSRADIVTEADLTRLAPLPKLDLAKAAAAPQIQPPRLALVRAAPSAADQLADKVVPLAELPPADFGGDLSRRGFQQPEMIIKQVKAERRAQAPTPDVSKRLSLSRDTFITGEVKDREILHREQVQAPRWLEEKGIEAEVVIGFVVNPDGEVGDKVFVQKTSGYAELDRLAVSALKKFVFAPLPLNVRQVEQNGVIVIRFTFLRQSLSPALPGIRIDSRRRPEVG